MANTSISYTELGMRCEFKGSATIHTNDPKRLLDLLDLIPEKKTLKIEFLDYKRGENFVSVWRNYQK